MDEAEKIVGVPDERIPELAASVGIFLNHATLEIELFKSGNHEQMCDVIIDLIENGAAKKRAGNLKNNPSILDEARFLADIEEIGKGRYAQRLASTLSHLACPAYINDAITYVNNKAH
jgi:putative ATP-dependent endonuclease of OLD family